MVAISEWTSIGVAYNWGNLVNKWLLSRSVARSAHLYVVSATVVVWFAASVAMAALATLSVRLVPLLVVRSMASLSAPRVFSTVVAVLLRLSPLLVLL